MAPAERLAFVVIVVGTFVAVAGDTPQSDASAASVASFYHDHRTAGWATAFLLAATAPLLVIFGVNLALALWSEQGAPGALWPAVLTIGSAIGATSFLIAAHGALAVADGVKHLTPETLQGLNVLDSDSWIVFNSALGWPALVLGIAHFIPFADFVALLLTGVWISVTSILQFRGSASLGRAPA